MRIGKGDRIRGVEEDEPVGSDVEDGEGKPRKVCREGWFVARVDEGAGSRQVASWRSYEAEAPRI